MRRVEVGAERVEPTFPHTFERFCPLGYLGESFRVEVTSPPAGVSCDGHVVRFPLHAQVLGHLRLPNCKRVGELAHGERSLSQLLNDVQTSGFP